MSYVTIYGHATILFPPPSQNPVWKPSLVPRPCKRVWPASSISGYTSLVCALSPRRVDKGPYGAKCPALFYAMSSRYLQRIRTPLTTSPSHIPLTITTHSHPLTHPTHHPPLPYIVTYEMHLCLHHQSLDIPVSSVHSLLVELTKVHME